MSATFVLNVWRQASDVATPASTRYAINVCECPLGSKRQNAKSAVQSLSIIYVVKWDPDTDTVPVICQEHSYKVYTL